MLLIYCIDIANILLICCSYFAKMVKTGEINKIANSASEPCIMN